MRVGAARKTPDCVAAGGRVRIHALQRWSRWAPGTNGQWSMLPVVVHGWAEFAADGDGVVKVDSATPLAGTYRRPDPLGLLWSAIPRGDARLPNSIPAAVAALDVAQEGVVVLCLEHEGQFTGRTQLESRGAPASVRVARVEQADLVGVLATPADADHLPTVVVLHGSEGADLQSCRAAAEVYAAKGFAALALAWYAAEWKGVKNVSTDGINVPIEVLERAHAFLRTRKEVDATRIGVVGSSKGAELAVFAATRFPWIKAVVGWVPSDVVWEGFGRAPATGETASTWSVAGTPVPYVPLIQFDPAKPGQWKSNTQRYNTSRAQASAAVVDAARIPIEKSTAAFLLLAGERDEVWASADMTKALVARMQQAGKSNQIEYEIYPQAGHQIGGVGVFPVWLYAAPDDNLDGLREGRDVLATGEAVVRAWPRAIEFLRKKL